jgi:Putative peptidoglycan binding domain
MKKLLTLTCCFGIALMTAAAQQNQQNKKKGGNPPPQRHVQTAPTKVHATPQLKKGTTFTGQKTTTTNFKGTKFSKQSNISGNAASTKFNKTTVNKTKNVTFQKQKFNLQTNKVVNNYKTVTFNKNYRIAGAGRWGPRYAVFVNYSPVWQPTWWWNWHYGSHIVFIYGGWYYWNAGYWFPAWGYAPNSVYYFDGPIYSSNPAYDPAQTVANVQSALQQQGYYQGDIDGILGPQTRAAIAEYQSAQGLEPTGLVDEPTLDSLGMA